jgi:hypothetical protein
MRSGMGRCLCRNVWVQCTKRTDKTPERKVCVCLWVCVCVGVHVCVFVCQKKGSKDDDGTPKRKACGLRASVCPCACVSACSQSIKVSTTETPSPIRRRYEKKVRSVQQQANEKIEYVKLCLNSPLTLSQNDFPSFVNGHDAKHCPWFEVSN